MAANPALLRFVRAYFRARDSGDYTDVDEDGTRILDRAKPRRGGCRCCKSWCGVLGCKVCLARKLCSRCREDRCPIGRRHRVARG